MDAPDSATRVGSSSYFVMTGGFAPGTNLAGCYRIVAQLGREAAFVAPDLDAQEQEAMMLPGRTAS